MMNRAAPVVALILAIVGGQASPAQAQILETVGIRALGMGGAFVAVADDSAATWWNPAGLADGPFLDMAIARTSLRLVDGGPGRDVATAFAVGTPPFGFSYYRLRITQIQPTGSTVPADARRQEGRAGTSASLDVSLLGATVIQTLIPGIHAATTLKYVRGTPSLDGGATASRFDLDAGVLAVAGPFRFGVVGRNLREPGFAGIRLPRQVRVGAAFDAEAIGGLPVTVSLDADARAYDAGAGERRAVAAGVEHWFRMRMIGVRGGVRVNTAGAGERTATAGVSWLVRPGVYAEGYLAGGDERGWGAAARVSF